MMATFNIALILACVSGVIGQQGPYFDKLMVVGPEGSFNTEVVDLSGSHLTCGPIANHSSPSQPGLAFLTDKVFSCGGEGQDSICHVYNNVNNEWEPLTNRTYRSHLHLSVQWSEDELWNLGGIYRQSSGDVNFTRQTEICSLKEPVPSCRPFEPLPADFKSGSNIVKTDDDFYILIIDDAVWSFENRTRLWTPLPPLNEKRRGASAGVVTSPSGRRAIVVAGGDFTITSEYMYLDTMAEWLPGPNVNGIEIPPLPMRPFFVNAGSVQYGNTFLMVGGQIGELSLRNSNMIYAFDPFLFDWIILPERLFEPRVYPSSVFIPDDHVNCN